jgi:uncharacterized protein (UPF0261 family)
MRTTADECTQLGKNLSEKTNAYTAATAILLPLKAISVISAAGQPFHDEVADKALFGAIKNNSTHPVIEIEQEINSPEFARACAEKLMELMQR